ncbi:MAG TPA: hypothetical protein VKI99_03680, partial [Candidatus Dormibacteraeota bacterium]|nr:hypothetical protein [Candidatus Dormibacteraeota bacterium]
MLADQQTLEQAGLLGVASREALVLSQAPSREGMHLLADDGRDGNVDPLFAGPISMCRMLGHAAAGQSNSPSECRTDVHTSGLAEAGPARIGWVAQEPPDRGAVPNRLTGGGRDAATGQ